MVDLAGAVSLGRKTLSVDGEATWSIGPIPEGVVGRTLSYQAVEAGVTSAVVSATIRLDDDGDGYGAGGLDCDDSDAAIHPGALDHHANGIDEDCDGVDLIVHWHYEGPEGPEFWGELHPDFAACSDGVEQSPIDLPGDLLDPTAIEPLDLTHCTTAVHSVNNGHTIQYDVTAGCSAVIGGTSYDLKQFHFHTPSEHAWDGVYADLEVHFVHKSVTGALAVIGVPLWAGAIEPLAFLEDIHWDMLPSALVGHHDDLGATFDPYELLEGLGERRFRYAGSLTTPPCTEGVAWTVMESGPSIDAEQVEAFKALFELNARPVQPLEARVVDLLDASAGP